MPAKTKHELLHATVSEYRKLQEILERFPAMLRLEKDGDGISARDIVGHRAHWIELFLGWYRDGQQGRDVFFPAEGYKWNQLKRYNSDLRRKQAGLSWQDAGSLLAGNHAELLAFIESLSDEQLYGAPMMGANNDWTPGRWAEAAGPSHYRSAGKYLRQRIRAYDAAQPEGISGA
ncbi:ClbS/DfsB family four-helix bundle protein [Roseibium sp.]|uniref:ClbS/DfsB family four-helix bundle protein n=1 Tax=Roseibium sp. TaxID=1936156 RepID=UPI0032643CEE